MSYVPPDQVATSMLDSGITRSRIGTGQLVLRSAVATFLLGAAVLLATTATGQTGVGVLGALLFPMGLVMVILLGLEHSVVNLFVIPAGMMLGAPVGIDDWWLWNQIPVLIGNLIGALALTSLPLYFAFRPRGDRTDPEAADAEGAAG